MCDIIFFYRYSKIGVFQSMWIFCALFVSGEIISSSWTGKNQFCELTLKKFTI